MPSLVNRRGHSPPRSWNRIALQRRFSRRFTRSASDFNRSSIPSGRWQESCSRKLIYLTSLLRTPIFHPNFEILVKSQLACGARATRGKGNEITEGAEFASRPAQILWRVKVIAMASPGISSLSWLRTITTRYYFRQNVGPRLLKRKFFLIFRCM